MRSSSPGRQDGYSTVNLGRWAQLRGKKIVSIDLEQDEARAQRCRERLASLPLTLLNGNAFSLFGRAVRELRGTRTALLVDGPKSWPALSMIAGAIEEHVEVFAQHNIAESVSEWSWFIGQGGCFYEDVIESGGSSWIELRRRENEHVNRVVGCHAQSLSTLGLIFLDDRGRYRLAHAWNLAFGLHQPLILRLMATLGVEALIPKLYGVSYRLLRR